MTVSFLSEGSNNSLSQSLPKQPTSTHDKQSDCQNQEPKVVQQQEQQHSSEMEQKPQQPLVEQLHNVASKDAINLPSSQKYKEIEGEKLNIPKQLRSEQRLHQHQQNHNNNHDENNNQPFNGAYASSNLISQPPYVPTDQKFSLPFSPNSIQNQLRQQEQIDSVGHWYE